MATPFTYATSDYFGKGSNYVGSGKEYMVTREVSIPDAITEFGAFTTSDVIQLITVPAQTWVKGIFVKVGTIDAACTDVDFGDGASTAGYLDAVTFAVTDVVFSSFCVTGDTTVPTDETYSVTSGGGKYYAAEDTIDLMFKGASNTTATFTITAIMQDMTQVG